MDFTQIADPAERVIIALDCSADEARAFADRLAGEPAWLKIGMTLYYSEGPAIVRELRERGFKVFVDLKLHDIPHQVRGAAASVVRSGADMFTAHTSGGADMMRAAVEGAREACEAEGRDMPIIIGVTVLTSMNDENLASIGVTRPMAEQVSALAQLAVDSGLAGIVCSPLEATQMRAQLGPQAAIVTPGIRLANAAADDQSRVMTPQKALAAGSSHLVIGRPITQAPDPLEAYRSIVASLRNQD